jgi:hypothetical protein
MSLTRQPVTRLGRRDVPLSRLPPARWNIVPALEIGVCVGGGARGAVFWEVCGERGGRDRSGGSAWRQRKCQWADLLW